MALERKDVRAKLDPDAHARLKAIVKFDDPSNEDIGAWIEQLILREIGCRYAAAREQSSLADELDRLGFSGIRRDSAGKT